MRWLHFLLNRLLEERLAGSRARIIQVTAGLHVAGRVDVDRTPRGEDFHWMKTYASTKLWNLLNTLELSRRWGHRSVTVNAVHPGIVRTRLGDLPGPSGWALRAMKLLWASPKRGARGPVHLATSSDLADQSGLYFNGLKLGEPAPVARDASLARELWQCTEHLLSLWRDAR